MDVQRIDGGGGNRGVGSGEWGGAARFDRSED
jgi:hypothetical protein